MRIEQIRCDFCGMEIKNHTGDKKIADGNVIFVNDIVNEWNSEKLCNKHYCSANCVRFAVEALCGTEPAHNDYLQTLAKKLGYKLTKNESIPKPVGKK